MSAGLIYDIGMHDGADTNFYLNKGFDVVAIDANPAMVARAKERFAREIDEGRLTIYGVALAETDGEIPFLVHTHDDWSRVAGYADYRFGEGTYKQITVPSLRFTGIYERHPDPRYVKLDIEGSELIVLRQMLATGRYPPFLSFEANQELDAILALLLGFGYDRFYLLAQQDKSWIKLPNPPKEGKFVPFDKSVSGPFGLEIPGLYVPVGELQDQISTWRAKANNGDMFALNEWHDIHACRSE